MSPENYSSLTPPIYRAMGDRIRPDRGVNLGIAIAWWLIQITVIMQFRGHASCPVIPQFRAKSLWVNCRKVHFLKEQLCRLH